MSIFEDLIYSLFVGAIGGAAAVIIIAIPIIIFIWILNKIKESQIRQKAQK